MNYRDRIKQFRRVPVEQLVPHHRNWRRHPPPQAAAMRAILGGIGYAGALLVRELDGGRYQILDGHLRAEVSPDQEVPVLVLDLNDTEAKQLLLTHDPLAGMAAADEPMLAQLIADTEFDSPAIGTLLASLQKRLAAELDPPEIASNEPVIGSMYQVAVQCRDEAEQEALFHRLTGEGYACRLLTM